MMPLPSLQPTPLSMLSVETSLLMVVDIQEKLIPIMKHAEELIDRTGVLITMAQTLGLPIVVTEQYPKGLGATVPALLEILEKPTSGDAYPYHRLEKTHFGCLGEPAIAEKLKALKAAGRHQVILCGMETHVCIHQTTQQLLAEGFEVHLIMDAIVARRKDNHKLAIARMLAAGAHSSGMETAMFELLKTSQHPHFKALQALVKER